MLIYNIDVCLFSGRIYLSNYVSFTNAMCVRYSHIQTIGIDYPLLFWGDMETCYVDVGYGIIELASESFFQSTETLEDYNKMRMYNFVGMPLLF